MSTLKPDTNRSPRRRSVPIGAWDQLSRRYDRQLWLERAAVAAAIDLLDPRVGDRLLDLGTGTGAVLRELASRPVPPTFAVGVDASAAMLARMRALPAGWSIRVADALALPFATDDFDVAVASYLMHILPDADVAPALAELARVIRPGGRLVTVTPVIPRREHPLSRAVAIACDTAGRVAPKRFGGLRAFDPGTALEAVGFTLVRGRVLTRGYPSLCVLATAPACR